MRIRLIVGYLGTHYSGYQSQPSGNTVQDKLEQALSRYFGGATIRTYAAGRTDAGVHATGQNVHFDTAKDVVCTKLVLGLNSYLPDDIVVSDASVVEDNWDARYSATDKTYVYRLYTSNTRRPLLDATHGRVYYNLDRQLLEQVASMLVGEHDYGAFQNTGSNLVGTVRTINSIDIEWVSDDQVHFVINGNAFLYNMVRIMVGCMVEVAGGKRPIDEVQYMLDSATRTKRRILTMPSCGLTLESVGYRGREAYPRKHSAVISTDEVNN